MDERFSNGGRSNGRGESGNWRRDPRLIPGGSQEPISGDRGRDRTWRTGGRSRDQEPRRSTYFNAPSGASISGFARNKYASDQDLSRHQTSANSTNDRPGSRQTFRDSSAGPSSYVKRPDFVGFKYLDQVMFLDDEQFATKLSTQLGGLSDLMGSELSGDLMVLVVRVVRRAADSTLVGIRNLILQAALQQPQGGFVDNLKKYVGLLPLQTQRDKRSNAYFWANPDRFWDDLLQICAVVLAAMPTMAVDLLPQILRIVKVYVPNIETEHGLQLDGVKTKVDELLEAVEERAKQFRKKDDELQERQSEVWEGDLSPPDDFRTVSVLPSSDEVLGDRSFLRRNVLKGGYTDVDHYLDVQFRLLREDFVAPLRNGIQSYLSDPEKRLENVRVYKKVRFLCPEVENMYRCVRIKFEWDSTRTKKIDFENSKRFMFGSLLCFTRDNFKTICFGRVANRKQQDLERGELIVGFHDNDHGVAADNSDDMLNDFQTDFVMVESEVYFEPYYHVMNALQRIRSHEFPMELYIVSAYTDVLPPAYVTEATEYVIGRKTLHVLGHWSQEAVAGAKLRLNDHQLEAYKAALATEFVIIQGPPGTGKTFLGLKIAEALMQNRAAWRSKHNPAPMLIVCYTNHALDQFLEGMVPFTGGRVVRIGGRCTNPNLQPYNLRALRTFDRSSKDMQCDMNRSMNNIKSATNLLKALQNWNGLLPFKDINLFSIIPEHSWLARAGLDDTLMWLFQKKVGNFISDHKFDTLVNTNPTLPLKSTNTAQIRHRESLTRKPHRQTLTNLEVEETSAQIVQTLHTG